ncbi:MAG: response regulator [Anaerolineae bacterium]|nr:response regulator [Anaerolineae bacterium]
MTKILVIEDEEAVRENIMEVLDWEGYETLGAQNGVVGIEQAQTHKPDLIICDISMPGMNGYDVLAKVRSLPAIAITPFIFLTARIDRTFMRHGMELGADDYLTKPFSTAELLSAITARLARQKLTSDEMAKDFDEARRELVRMIAHELRTPLVSIEMATDMITDRINEISRVQLNELLGFVQRGRNRLYHVVEQMVYLTQINAGMLTSATIETHGILVSIPDLLMATASIARRFAPQRPNVNIRFDIQDSGAIVLCDPSSIKHAVAELFANAINFSNDDQEVMVTNWVAENNVWIQITDQGSGIPDDKIEQAMREFTQVDRQSQEQQGMGIGLPLARHIIELHGGTFELASVVGRGTQITIRLNQADQEDDWLVM